MLNRKRRLRGYVDSLTFYLKSYENLVFTVFSLTNCRSLVSPVLSPQLRCRSGHWSRHVLFVPLNSVSGGRFFETHEKGLEVKVSVILKFYNRSFLRNSSILTFRWVIEKYITVVGDTF